MGTVIHYVQGGKVERQQRWEHTQRAERLDMYRALQAQGVSQRQAAKVLNVPRTTLQAWRAWPETLNTCPHVGTFFASGSGLAYLHRLIMALPVVFIEIGASGIRLVCLFLQRRDSTGLGGFVWDAAAGEPACCRSHGGLPPRGEHASGSRHASARHHADPG